MTLVPAPVLHAMWGVGLRPAHFSHWRATPDLPPWLEVMADNHMFHQGGPGLVCLDRLAARTGILLHGVGLSIASAEAPEARYLEALRALSCRLDAAVISDHLCFTRAAGRESYDLLPIPHTAKMLGHVCSQVARVQVALGEKGACFALENVSSYVSFSTNEMSEMEFLREVCTRTGCGLLLDVNNVYVSARNHGFDARSELAKVDPQHVRQYHVAGHSEAEDFLHDTHDAPVRGEVWELLRYSLGRTGPRPVILERDDEGAHAEDLVREIREGLRL